MTAPSPRLLTGGLAAAAGLVAVLTLLSRVVGLGRWMAFSHGVGATCVGQAYATANQVPNVLYEVAAGGALAVVAVPLVSRYLTRGDERTADQVASALLTWAITLLVPLGVLVALLATPISRALLSADGACGPEAVPVAARMLVIFAPQLVLYGIGVVLAGVLQAHRRFLAAALAPLLSSLVAIATYLLYPTMVPPETSPGQTPAGAVALLAGGTTLAVAALSLPLLLPTARAGVRLRPTWRFPAGAGEVRSLALAGALAVAAQQVCVLVTVRLANAGADQVGTLNVYSYAQVAYLLPYAVLVVPLATVAFPRLTDPAQARSVLARTTALVAVTGVVGVGLLIGTRREIGAVFAHLDAGSSGPGQAALGALPVAVLAYAPGLLGLGLTALLSRALYARGDAWAAGGAVALGWLVAAVLPVLVLLLGDPGGSAAGVLGVLGVASSIGMLVSAALLVVLVRRRWGHDALSGAVRPALAAAAGVAVVLVVRELLAAGGTGGPGLGGALLGAAALAAVLLAAAGAALRLGAPATYGALLTSVRRRGGD